MKSLQSKIAVLVLCCSILATLIPLSIGFGNTEKMLEEDSTHILNLLCTNEANQMDEIIRNIEESVNTLYQFSIKWMPEEYHLFESSTNFEEYVNKMKEASLNVVENTDGAISVYFRFNPEYTNSVSGYFLVEDESGAFKEHAPTDLSSYSKDDVDRVGWYYLPLQMGEAIWMDPYFNGVVDRELISYVVPVYDGDIPVGVLGMDIDLELLRKRLRTISLYETGFAVLMDSEGNVVYHKDYPSGVKINNFDSSLVELNDLVNKAQLTGEIYSYEWKNVNKRMVTKRLQNDMVFVITVPESEIAKPKWKLLVQSIVLGSILIIASVLVGVRMSRRLVRPLKQLNEAAKKIATGDMNVTIECATKDEVGMLADSFRKTAESLNGYIKYINRLAFRDSLTQVGNKTAYDEMVGLIEADIAVGVAKFAVVVMDLNNLKLANDTYGHNTGDALLLDAATAMRRVFNNERIYRIGGDEFAVILLGDEISKVDELSEKFEAEVARFNQSEEKKYEMELQIAIGSTVYDKEKDLFFLDVFRRADKLMYENKSIQKRSVR